MIIDELAHILTLTTAWYVQQDARKDNIRVFMRVILVFHFVFSFSNPLMRVGDV